MSSQDNVAWVLLAFILVAFLALHFGLQARSMSMKVRKLQAENDRLKASGKTDEKSTSMSHDAVIAAFIFGLSLGGASSTVGDGHDPDLTDDAEADGGDHDLAGADIASTTASSDV